MDSLACSYSARFDAPGALFFVPPCDSFPPKCARSRGRSTKWRSCRYLSSSTLPLVVASRQLRPLFARASLRQPLRHIAVRIVHFKVGRLPQAIRKDSDANARRRILARRIRNPVKPSGRVAQASEEMRGRLTRLTGNPAPRTGELLVTRTNGLDIRGLRQVQNGRKKPLDGDRDPRHSDDREGRSGRN